MVLPSETLPNVRNWPKLTVRESYKGRGLYANSTILSGVTICYYTTIATKYTTDMDCTYAITLYYKNGSSIQHLYGRLDDSILEMSGVPCCGHLINEPSAGEYANAYMSYRTSHVYANRRRIVDGDHLTYEIESERDIAQDEEILIDYGPNYVRSAYNTIDV